MRHYLCAAWPAGMLARQQRCTSERGTVTVMAGKDGKKEPAGTIGRHATGLRAVRETFPACTRTQVITVCGNARPMERGAGRIYHGRRHLLQDPAGIVHSCERSPVIVPKEQRPGQPGLLLHADRPSPGA